APASTGGRLRRPVTGSAVRRSYPDVARSPAAAPCMSDEAAGEDGDRGDCRRSVAPERAAEERERAEHHDRRRPWVSPGAEPTRRRRFTAAQDDEGDAADRVVLREREARDRDQ